MTAARAALIVLIVCVIAGFALRAGQAADPTRHLSADERAYGRVAQAISLGQGYGDPAMRDPYQWAPGAPALFALADRIGPSQPHAKFQIRSAYWAQAVVGTLVIAVVFLLGRLLAGEIAGAAAAIAAAFYPPLIWSAGHQLSEPLGALGLAGALAALAWAWRARAEGGRSGERGGASPWLLAFSGVLFGLTVLTRADLLLAPLIAAIVAAVALPAGEGWRGRLGAGLALLGASLVVIVPWVTVASLDRHRLIPVSDGGASALYVGTYLPGDGTLFGLKRHLAAETRRRVPEARHLREFQIKAEYILRAVADRHPHVPERTALRREAFHNLHIYALRKPLDFLAMMARKVGRMWLHYDRGTRLAGQSTSTPVSVVHLLLLFAALAGMALGVWRSRNPVLVAIVAIVAYSTLANSLLIAEARHNLPLLPVLWAGGAAGWLLARRRSSRLVKVARADYSA